MIDLFKEEQPIASKIIENAVDKNYLVHAYIIETNGYEKGYDFALSFAKLLLCPHNKFSSLNCENCYQCNAIDSGNYSELEIINPDGSWIKKEQLLNLQNEFSKKTIIGNRKVYIINKADRLNINASNTILKFLEEPAEGIIAILLTNNVYQLLETIVSRCQIISLNGQAKKGNNIKEKLGLLLYDNVNDYDNFVQDETILDKIEIIIKFICEIEKNGVNSIIYTNKNFFDYFQNKENISWAIIIMLYFYKDVLNFKINSSIEIFDDYTEQIKYISEKNKIENIINIINKINECRKNIDLNANLNLSIDRLIIDMKEGVK